MYLLLALVVGLIFAGTGIVMGYVAPVWSALLTLVPLLVIGTTVNDPPLTGLVIGTAVGISIRVGAILHRWRSRALARAGNLPVARVI
jgi:hypothetical protein